MSIGIAAAALRLVVAREERVDLGFLALGIGFLGMFIGSALPSGAGFSVARVMMIIFTFSIPFAVVGARELGNLPLQLVERINGRVSFPWQAARVSLSALAVLAAVFFLLNAGVVSELVTNDVAPSNRISQERLLNSENPNLRLRATACTSCNVETHAWAGSEIPDGETLYGDVRVDNQRDFYRGTLASRDALGLRYSGIELNQTDVPTGSYLAIQEHNTDLSGFTIGYKFFFFEKDMDEFTSGNKLYTTGYGAVYYEGRK